MSGDLESVLDPTHSLRCFSTWLKSPTLINHRGVPWSSGSFGVAKLTRACRLFKNVPNGWLIDLATLDEWPNDDLCDGFVLLFQPNDAVFINPASIWILVLPLAMVLLTPAAVSHITVTAIINFPEAFVLSLPNGFCWWGLQLMVGTSELPGLPCDWWVFNDASAIYGVSPSLLHRQNMVTLKAMAKCQTEVRTPTGWRHNVFESNECFRILICCGINTQRTKSQIPGWCVFPLIYVLNQENPGW